MTGFVRAPYTDIKNEERREWLRIEDRLLLEYRRSDEPAEAMNAHLPPATEDTIATAVSKPTIDLLVRAGETFAGSPLLPWVSKIDWMLETILKSLVKSHPGKRRHRTADRCRYQRRRAGLRYPASVSGG
jgi:hypothetical protein